MRHIRRVPPDEPITDCHDKSYNYEYVISAKVTDPLLERAGMEVVAAEVQQALFWDGAVTVGFFEVESIRGNRVTFRIERYGCEEDYHNCYSRTTGHDGSDLAAIAQLQGEMWEAIENCPSEVWLGNVLVEQRIVYVK